MMNPNVYRLTKSMLMCSSFGVGPLTRRIMKHYHTAPAPLVGTMKHNPNIQDEPEPFSIINPDLIVGYDLNYSWMNRKTYSCHILGSGMIVLKNYISLLGQVGMVNLCDKLGSGPGGFYMPRNQDGHTLRLHMMCFGRNWDPVTGYNNQCRIDGSEPPPLSYGFVHLAKIAIEDAQAHMHELSLMCPDTCIVNFFRCGDRLGIHQDCDESSDSLERGLPVLSIFIGDDAEFWYGHIRDENKYRKVVLESGDVLIYGGTSRLIYHGVKIIIPGSAPVSLLEATKLMPGCLSLTLKQY
ncbi:hypothetical protein QVD17_29430 [Tagetes erecta]|uniref:Alpha-ketoglutarate-dependent dioxygenase AlkB-like domain-containing protein n=1 Tax=Tagetes erecta TaxID=13708 RepID=A0AAD8KHZ4_TARER|nr:hypothetical protein QVD17_29430 [Tagetes erecta]